MRIAPALAAALLPLLSGCPQDKVEPTNGFSTPLPVEDGGTGAADAAAARTSLAAAGTGVANTFTATQTISAGDAPALVLTAAAGQTQPLQEWRSSGGAVLASIDANGAFSGIGSAITNISATAIASGTLDSTFLDTDVCRLDVQNVFLDGQQVRAGMAATVGLEVRGANGQTANLQNWSDDAGTPLAFVDATGTFSGGGSLLTDLDASELTSGTVASGRISGTYSNAVTFSSASNAFSGSGAGLTALDAGALASGTLPTARLSGAYSSALTFSNIANVYFGDGSNLSGITTSGLAAGTYSNAYTFDNASNVYHGDGSNLDLSGNYASAVDFDNASNTFTGSFTGSGAALTGIAKIATRPFTGCTVTGGGAAVECGGMPCGAAPSCLAAAIGCSTFCVDSATPAGSLMIGPVTPTTGGVLRVSAARPVLICRTDEETYAEISLTVDGAPASTGSVILGTPLVTGAPWREMPAAIDATAFVGAGPHILGFDVDIVPTPPYASAVCFFGTGSVQATFLSATGGL